MIAASLFTLGCGEEVKDVNRVQPDYVEKQQFSGDWYFRQTVVDVPPETAMAFVGLEAGFERIRWEIREDQLVARKSYEAVPGLNANDLPEREDFLGEPVAAYQITKHFDIIRQFNEQTGGQSNVLVEDESLRPWHERDYIRVDWSTNMISSQVDFDGMMRANGAAAEYVSDEYDPFDPRRIRIEDDAIMFTNRFMASDGGFGCLVNYGQPLYGDLTCGPTEIGVRSAFVKIDTETEDQLFEPVQYQDRVLLRDAEGNRLRYITVGAGDQMIDVACTPEVLDTLATRNPNLTERDCRDLQVDMHTQFGFFRTERTVYDRRLEPGHDLTRRYYANHHRMWERVKDDEGNLIPMADRQLRPIVYYTNVGYPEDLWTPQIEGLWQDRDGNTISVTHKLMEDWNDTFMAAAMAATGRSRSDIEADLEARYGDRHLYVIRENTCSADGIADYVERFPAMEQVVADASEGQGVLPGNLERVCSGLNYFSTEWNYAKEDIFQWQQLGDPRNSYVVWVNESQPVGPLGYGPSSADPLTGQIMSGNAHVYGAAVDSYARSAADTVLALNGEEGFLPLDLREGISYLEWIENQQGTTESGLRVEMTPALKQAIQARIGTTDIPGFRKFVAADGTFNPAAMMRHMRDRVKNPSQNDPFGQAVLSPVSSGQQMLEQLREDPEIRARLVTPQMLALVSPFFNWSPGDDVSEEMSKMAFDMVTNPAKFNEAREARNAFLAEHNVYMASFLDDAIVGQALALKDLDAETLWRQLREEIYLAVQLHEIGHTVGLRHNFKASFDALNYQDEYWDIRAQYPDVEGDAAATAANRRQRFEARSPEYRYASIMDYGSRFNSDTKGLGKYDTAAIKMVYGGKLEAFEDDVTVPPNFKAVREMTSYTKLPELMGSTDNFNRRTDVGVDDVMADRAEGIVRNAELFVENPDRAVTDYWWDRVVPYYFCSDEYRGDLWCRTWDDGPSHTEAVESAIQRYWNYFLFNNYRRGRNEYSFINGYFGRQARLAEYLVYPWNFYQFYYAYDNPEVYEAGFDLPEDLLQASLIGLNFVQQVLATPEPGRYCYSSQFNQYFPNGFTGLIDPFDCTDDLNTNGYPKGIDVGLGLGRDFSLDFDDQYFYNIDYLGTYYDKSSIVFHLFDSNTRFFRWGDESDERRFSINYYRSFRPELVNLVRDMLFAGQGFVGTFGFYNRVDNKGVVTPSPLVSAENFNLEDPNADAMANAPLVYGRMSYDILQNTMFYATVLATSTNDRQTDFVNYIRIFEQGSIDGAEIDRDVVEVATFENPLNGAIYEAVQTTDGLSVAYDLVLQANRRLANDWQPAKNSYDQDPSDPARRELLEQQTEELLEFVELMDDMRFFTRVIDELHNPVTR